MQARHKITAWWAKEASNGCRASRWEIHFQTLLLIFYNHLLSNQALYFQSGLEGIHAIFAYLQYSILLLLFCYSFGYGKYFGTGWMKGQKEMLPFFFPQKPNSLLRCTSGLAAFLLERVWSILCPWTPNRHYVLCQISKRMGEIGDGSRKMPFVLCS